MNFPGTKLSHRDVSCLSSDDLKEMAGGTIDGIIGGPPCQAFSEIGRRDASDPRRYLVSHFFRLVREIRPKFFVMENVRGLLFENNREILDAALERVRGLYSIWGPTIIEASNFGAPTRRPRAFVVGFRDESCVADFAQALERRLTTPVFVSDAISDLVSARSDGIDSFGFDRWRYPTGGLSRYASRARTDRQGDKVREFSGHRRTQHSKLISDRFAALAQGSSDPIGKHIRLRWDAFGPTIRAGTGADRGSYQSVRPIHPTEPRVITPREAARLQGFPDWFRFHPTVWHSFRMIGNSVSPIVSAAILGAVWECVDNNSD